MLAVECRGNLLRSHKVPETAEIKSKNKYYLHPGENLDLKSLTGLNEIFIGIGPEGGFSPEEISSFKSKGFQGVSIGDLIIKTETVPTVLLSMLKVI